MFTPARLSDPKSHNWEDKRKRRQKLWT